MTANRSKAISGRLAFGLALLIMILVASAADLSTGRRQAASAEEEWTKVTLVYSSDCKGKIEPCG